MGEHDETAAERRGAWRMELEVVHMQLWSVADSTQVAIWGSYSAPAGARSLPLAGGTIGYQLLQLPSVGQMFYAYADELRRNHALWQENK